MDDIASQPCRSAGARTSLRVVAGAVIGNALEYYDFMVYSYFALQIGHEFFPQKSEFASLMLSLATFGTGDVSRPLGAVVIGAFADRAGRKPAMILSFALMGISMLLAAAIPGYASIGVAAPLVLVLCRLLQGFAMGGEVGPTITYLVEIAPPEKRGLYCAWQSASQGLAVLIAGAGGLILIFVLGNAHFIIWGWRVAFLFGAVLLPVGLVLRQRMPETFSLRTDAAHSPFNSTMSIGRVAKNIALGFFIVGSSNARFSVLTFMTTYAATTLGMSVASSFAPTATFGGVLVVASLAWGWLSDKWGRRAILLSSTLIFFIIVIPLYSLIAHYRTLMILLGSTALLSFFYPSSVIAVAIAEQFPRHLRSLSLAIIYAAGPLVFGATAQPIVAWLIKISGDPRAPGYYLFGIAMMGLVAMTRLRPSATAKTAR